MRWVYEAAEATEADWIEWKSEHDLSEKRYAASAARHILGFSNRNPDRALRNAQGLGYLLIGVEPGRLIGVPEMWDPEKIESWLSPYVGDGVAWEPAYVEIDGRHVLFLTVEAPNWGDPPHPFRKEASDEHGKTIREGWVYIRRPGKTEQVNAAEHDQLIERARGRQSGLKLALEAEGLPLLAINAEVLETAHRDRVLTEWRKRLLRGAPQELGPFEFAPPGETRQPAQYRRQAESFIEATRERWSAVVVVDVVSQEQVPLTLSVVNLTSDVFEEVQIEARLPLNPAWVYSHSGEAQQRLKPPREPAPWGDHLGSLTRDMPTSFFASGGVEIETEEHGVLLRYPPVLVRPNTRHRLAKVLLALPPFMAGQEIPVQWRATSSSVGGEDGGLLKLAVAGQGPATEAGQSASAPETQRSTD